MVFTAVLALARNRGPDQFWKRHTFLQYAASFYGRRRNCKSLAFRAVRRSFMFATRGRKVKREDLKELWTARLEGACEEVNTTYDDMYTGLQKCHVYLDRRVLSDLAIWEPQTFKSLAALGTTKQQLDPPHENHNSKYLPQPHGVFTKKLL